MSLSPAEARKRNRAAFDKFWQAYPRRVAPTEAEREFTNVLSSGKVTADELIAKARAYGSSVDPSDLRYVPAPHAWLRQGRWGDEDLFVNKAQQQQEWFRQCWREANVTAVENKFCIKFPTQYPPENITDVESIKRWYRETARAWIAEVAREKLPRA